MDNDDNTTNYNGSYSAILTVNYNGKQCSTSSDEKILKREYRGYCTENGYSEHWSDNFKCRLLQNKVYSNRYYIYFKEWSYYSHDITYDYTETSCKESLYYLNNLTSDYNNNNNNNKNKNSNHCKWELIESKESKDTKEPLWDKIQKENDYNMIEEMQSPQLQSEQKKEK